MSGISKSWMQGSFVKKEDLSKLLDQEIDFEYAVVISQPCDIHHHCFENEPYIELILVNETDDKKAIGQNKNAKVARKLAIKFYDVSDGANPQEKTLLLEAKNKVRIEKEKFFKLEPDPNLSLEEEPGNRLRSLAFWLGMRYSRPYLPDEFDRRLRYSLKEEKAKEFISKHEKCIHSININLLEKNDELSSSEEYTATILLLTNPEINDQQESEIDLFLEKLRSKLKTCNVTAACKRKCISKITVMEYELYERYPSFDSISISNESFSGLD